MAEGLDKLIRRIQTGDLPETCSLPLTLACTEPYDSILFGTVIDTTIIGIFLN